MSIALPDVPTGANLVGTSGFSSQYVVDVQNSQNLASDMWDDNFWEQLQNLFGNNPPYSAIISLIVLPYIGSNSSGVDGLKYETTARYIKLGKTAATTAQGLLITNQYYRHRFGAVQIPTLYGNFLDYAPYTKVSVYLPFIGMVDVPTNVVMGKYLQVAYIIDTYTGGFTAYLAAWNNYSSGVGSGGVGVFSTHVGSCRIDIPFSEASGGSVGQAIMTAVSGGVSMSSADAGRISSAPVSADNSLGGALSTNTYIPVAKTANVAQHAFDQTVTHRGTACSNVGITGFLSPRVYVTRPNAIDSAPDRYNYASVVGRPCGKRMTLGDLEGKGFTQVESVNLSGVCATLAEKNELENMLKSGVIL